MLVIAVASIFISYWIAKKSGSFKRVLLNVYLMNQQLIARAEFDEIVFGYWVGEHDIAFFKLPFRITNSGDRSAKNVCLTLSIPLALRCGGLKDNVEIDSILGRYERSDIKRLSSQYAGFERLDYVFPEIGPGESFEIEEFIDVVRASGMPFEVEAVSKDRVPVRVKGNIGWSAQIDVRISATDVVPLDGHFQIRSYRVRNEEDLGKELMKDETQALREELSKKGTPRKLVSQAYAPGVKKNTIIVMSELKKTVELKVLKGVKASVHEEIGNKTGRWFVASALCKKPMTIVQWLRRKAT